MTLLGILIAAIPVVLAFGGVRWLYVRHRDRPIMLDEWRARMRDLDTTKPVASRLDGTMGVTYSKGLGAEPVNPGWGPLGKN
jgi:hypothetical protein